MTDTCLAFLPMRSTIVNTPLARFFLLLLPIAFLSAGDARALGLGKMTVLSSLGKRFEAEVQLIDGSAEQRSIAECFRLGQPGSADADVPALTQGRVTLEKHAGRLRLRVVSDQIINEPVLQVNLRAGCGAEVVRNYLLLIDPPRARMAPRAVELPAVSRAPVQVPLPQHLPARNPNPGTWRTGKHQSARGIARLLFPQQPRTQVRFLRALQAANPATDLGSRGGRQLPAGTQLHLPASRQGQRADRLLAGASAAAPEDDAAARDSRDRPVARKSPAAGRAQDRLEISSAADSEQAQAGHDSRLRLSARLSVKRQDKTSDDQRALLRLEFGLLSALHAQAAQQLALAEQIRSLEATLGELQNRTASAARPAEPAAAISAAVLPAAPRPPPPSAAPSEAPVAGKTNGWWDWLAITLLGALIAGLIWLLRWRAEQRSRRPTRATATEEASRAGEKPGKVHTDSVWELQMTRRSDSSPVVAESQTNTDTASLADDGPSAWDELPAMSEDDEGTAVLELAEIMLSFGRIEGAVQALEEFVANKPTAAVPPWLKLLDLYRQDEQREAFEAAGLKLKRHFNVAPPDWETAAEASRPGFSISQEDAPSIDQLLLRLPTIRQWPHIANEILRTWGSLACIHYLKALLRDNRSGERRGFALGTVREFLFLIDLQESRLPRRP
ncbi:Tfp pilus assembly protein FimV-like protein [Candidatus Accumulibacter aalborgensis]|uniref:Tfp pilus assembly protein FimV-like protein n=1 Tax=Candidatus Accumulibacter aalborgensis TaxID=1860102 RepID=A0A1A8XTP8_9PROT|nr:hypothetical protein [Candidatus Accumulibacter aalborgensis]SBT08454.1 Tfp pilus assembly protein FimV-like protein [Candidatus Accumulibacter aalborgensis]